MTDDDYPVVDRGAMGVFIDGEASHEGQVLEAIMNTVACRALVERLHQVLDTLPEDRSIALVWTHSEGDILKFEYRVGPGPTDDGGTPVALQ